MILATIFRWSGGLTILFSVVAFLLSFAGHARGDLAPLAGLVYLLPAGLIGLLQIGLAQVIEAVIRTALASERAASALEDIVARAKSRDAGA